MRRNLKSPSQIIRLAERHVAYVDEPGPEAFLAWVRLGRLMRGLHTDQAFDLACHVVRTVPAPHLRSFGGGVLAHLVQYHGAGVIDWIEAEASREATFLEALSSVCLATEELDPFVILRLQAATGGSIRIFTRRQRDATYRGIFNGSITSTRKRWARRAQGRTRRPPVSLVRDSEQPSLPGRGDDEAS